MNIRTGESYRGRIIVDSPVFEVLPKHIISKLEDIGFDEVQVWFYKDELPSDWPDDKKDDVSDFGETQVYLQGVWRGDNNVEIPSGGEQWKLYDVWQHGESKEATSYGKRQTSLGKAMYVGAWALGIFLVGFPIVLAATADNDEKR